MNKILFVFIVLLNSAAAHAHFPLFYSQDKDTSTLIDWKAGDSSDYTLKVLFGEGTLHKEVKEDEGNGVWLSQVVNIMGRDDETEVLIDRNTGKILKMIHNGRETKVPNDPPEIIDQDYEEVTVPAGTFNALHIIAKTKQVKRIEMWVNTRDVVIDGAIKEIMASQMGDITIELTGQHRSE